jgi:hypothetical protein
MENMLSSDNRNASLNGALRFEARPYGVRRLDTVTLSGNGAANPDARHPRE